MWRSVDVFVPSAFPTLTYVERQGEKLEKRVREAIETPRSPISISGPSKTGKTALIKNIVGDDNLIHIFGTQINSPDDIWSSILKWMDAPSSTTSGLSSQESITPNANASGEIKLPGVAKVSLGGGISTNTSSGINSSDTRHYSGMSAVAKEIANSEFIVFLDDFHYINRELQESVGRQIKAGSEIGIRFCIASVPHRSDDVVRSNHELRGRTINIDTSFWSEEDLYKIGTRGFEALNLNIAKKAIKRLARESCTSPQIMQSLCLQMCFDLDIRESVAEEARLTVGENTIQSVLEKTSTRADYSSLIKQMHAGPRTRGTERKEFSFSDRSRGDAYRASLLALKQDPPRMEFNYSEMLSRISSVCADEKPVGSSITESLKQISNFANIMHPNQRIVEWDAEAAQGTFAIIDPYFLFFLRASKLLDSLK